MKTTTLKKLLTLSLSALLLTVPAVSVSGAAVQTQTSQAAASSLTEGDFAYSVNEDGTVAVTEYNGSDSIVEIPSVIGGKKVTAVGDKAFEDNKTLAEVKFPDRMTKIGFSAFSRCTSLKKLVIPEGVTYIGSGAFSGCSKMTGISLPKTLTDIERFAFANCSSLKTVSLPNKLQVLDSSVFEGCTSLKTVRLPANLTAIFPNAFGGCSSLVSVTVPEKVKKLYALAFRDCSELRNCIVTGSSTRIDKLTFENCTLLTIYGKKGSAAQAGASEYNIPFSTKKAPPVSTSSLSTKYPVYGESVTLKASAIDGTAPYQYAVYYRSSDSENWIRAASYSDNKTITVTPRAAGTNIVRLKIKDAAGKITNTDYRLEVSPKLTNTSKISTSTAKTGEKVELTCKAKGSKGYLYSISVRKGKYADWTEVSDYSDLSAVSVTQNAPATYFYKITAKDAYGCTSEKILPVRFTR